MRPSIMSDVEITSQPAWAWTTALRHSASRVSSLTISPSRSRPSWPSLLKASRATSHITPISGCESLIVRTARQTRLSGFQASSQPGDLRAGSVAGNSATNGTPSRFASPTAVTARSTVKRTTPGIEGTGVVSSVPSRMKTGQIRSLGDSRFSRTSRRDQSVRRLRRMRVRGKTGPAGGGGRRVMSWPRPVRYRR